MPERVFKNNRAALFNLKQAHVFPGSESKVIPLMSTSFGTTAILPGLSVEAKIMNAIGRIGQRYNPAIEVENRGQLHSYSKGTGTLITHNNILTNQHVYDRYIKNNMGRCGIEFLAISGYGESNFHFFSEKDPFFLDGLDAVILTLKTSPLQDPIPIQARSIVVGTEVKVIGYPHPLKFPDNILYKQWDLDTNKYVYHDVSMYGGPKAIFSVKRQSVGKIFRPQGSLPGQNNFYLNHGKLGKIPIFCFNATAGNGSSGSPVLNKNNDLLGIYFTGDTNYLGDVANLAIPVNALISAILPGDLDKLPEGPLNNLIKSTLPS